MDLKWEKFHLFIHILTWLSKTIPPRHISKFYLIKLLVESMHILELSPLIMTSLHHLKALLNSSSLPPRFEDGNKGQGLAKVISFQRPTPPKINLHLHLPSNTRFIDRSSLIHNPPSILDLHTFIQLIQAIIFEHLGPLHKNCLCSWPPPKVYERDSSNSAMKKSLNPLLKILININSHGAILWKFVVDAIHHCRTKVSWF
jgi:hypothetical protein